MDRVEYKIANYTLLSHQGNNDLEDWLNSYGSKGWQLYELSANAKPSGVKDPNGQPIINLEYSALFFRIIEGERIELTIEDPGVGSAKSVADTD